MDVLSKKAFPHVLILRHGWAGQRTVTNAWDAWECLTGAWPVRNGKAARMAVRLCRDALDGFISVKSAYEAFLRALDEAGIAYSKSHPASHQSVQEETAKGSPDKAAVWMSRSRKKTAKQPVRSTP